uniref:F-box domain-containing protein n=1 Tax=Oryza rufipogon TaxID=4529 RepID=A0A0E0RDB7_ORYRU
MKQSRREEVDDDVSVGKKEEEAGYCSSSSISRLPEACLAHAISFTTPTDACRCSAVSADFQAAASSNAVWERFLPPDYHSILARADDPSFWLERTSGAKCYLLSSRSLEIAWGDDARYWRWIYLPDSRFERVAALVFVCWFHLRGRINCRELSPNTRYIVYLIFKLADKSYGLDCRTQEAYITMDDQVVSAKRTVSLHPRTQETPLDMGRSEVGRAEETVSYPRERGDGWMEVQLGHFYNHQGDGMVVINLQEIVQLNSKKGLILEGMEIRHSIGP